jgi:hypothetical protein
VPLRLVRAGSVEEPGHARSMERGPRRRQAGPAVATGEDEHRGSPREAEAPKEAATEQASQGPRSEAEDEHVPTGGGLGVVSKRRSQ